VAADERFAVVLNNITKARRQRYSAVYRARPQTDAPEPAYMRDYGARPRTETAERVRKAGYMKSYRSTTRAEAVG
jgi:hypothetical protein